MGGWTGGGREGVAVAMMRWNDFAFYFYFFFLLLWQQKVFNTRLKICSPMCCWLKNHYSFNFLYKKKLLFSFCFTLICIIFFRPHCRHHEKIFPFFFVFFSLHLLFCHVMRVCKIAWHIFFFLLIYYVNLISIVFCRYDVFLLLHLI